MMSSNAVISHAAECRPYIVRRDSSATAVHTESNSQALGDDAEQLPMTTVYMKMFSKLFQLNLIGPCGKLSVSHINACTLHYFDKMTTIMMQILKLINLLFTHIYQHENYVTVTSLVSS